MFVSKNMLIFAAEPKNRQPMSLARTDMSKTNVNYHDSKSRDLWERLKNVLKRNLGLTAIIAAALLLAIHYAMIKL